MPHLSLANGHQLYYEVLDLTDAWIDAPTVFLHHGLNKSGRWWLPWVRLLCRDFRVVSIDMLGCGRSDQPLGYAWSVADHAANAVQVINHLGIDRVHFIGETVGGCVGLHLGARNADRLHTLSIASCPYRPDRDWLLRQSREAADDMVGAVDRDLPSRLDWTLYPKAMYDWYRTERLSASATIAAEQYAAQADEDLEWTLPLIEPPTLLFIPDESPVAANQQMREMARVIPRAHIADLPPRRRPVWYHFGEAPECVTAFQRFVARVA